MPAKSADDIRERGKILARAEGVRLLRMEHQRAVLEVDSGTYSFESQTGTDENNMRQYP